MPLCSIFFAVLLSLSSFCHAQTPYRVVIDPGHGGSDLGAVRDSFIESHIVLSIAEKVKHYLDQKKYIVSVLTRKNDKNLSLQDRVDIAANMKADLFISLHANSSPAKSVSGMEFYFNSPQKTKKAPADKDGPATNKNEVIARIKQDFLEDAKTEKSLLLTQTIQQNVSQDEEQRSVIRRAPFYVIEHTPMPAALIELGFISNRRDAKRLVSEDYQDKMSQLIADAIEHYYELSLPRAQ
jgi:N-acetylmuramoyl-L-alanine amidase